LTPEGRPFARYHVRADGRFNIEAGFPVGSKLAGNGSVQPSMLPSGDQAVIWHTGPYDQVGAAYAVLAEWIEEQGGTPEGDAWEIYHDPPAGDPSHWQTEVVQPYRAAGGQA
jgi:effector-binding domain-containing protein